MAMLTLDKYENWLGWKNKLARACWIGVHALLVRPFDLPQLWFWRRFWLTLFGARLDRRSHIYASVSVWAPWNLEMGPLSFIASGVRIYNVGPLKIGSQVTISQGAYLCNVSHDISDPKFRMVCSPMAIDDQVWIASEAYVGGRDIRVGEGAVIAARAVVFQSVEPWSVMVGNPARSVKKRMIKAAAGDPERESSVPELLRRSE